jgi:hypothetical protein
MMAALPAMLSKVAKSQMPTRSDGRAFEPLVDCQDRARRFRSDLLQSDSGFDDSQQNLIHAFEALVNLINCVDGPDEDESVAACDLIAKEFGGKLAYALARGLISRSAAPVIQKVVSEIGSEAVRENIVTPSASVAQEVNTCQQESKAQELVPDLTLESVSQTKFDVIDLSTSVTKSYTQTDQSIEQPIELKSGHSETTLPQIDPPPATFAPSHPSWFHYSAGETTSSLAAEMAVSNPHEIPEAIKRLAWLALTEQKFSLAYHLIRGVEQLSQGENPELSVRIRALALGLEIRQPLGLISEQ